MRRRKGRKRKRRGGSDGYGSGIWKLISGSLRELKRVKVKAKDNYWEDCIDSPW